MRDRTVAGWAKRNWVQGCTRLGFRCKSNCARFRSRCIYPSILTQTVVKAAVEESASTSQEYNDTCRILAQPLDLCFRKPEARSLDLIVGFLLYKASPGD